MFFVERFLFSIKIFVYMKKEKFVKCLLLRYFFNLRVLLIRSFFFFIKIWYKLGCIYLWKRVGLEFNFLVLKSDEVLKDFRNE